MRYFICVSSSKCWVYRYWYRLCIRYIFCQTLEWAEIYVRMWRTWDVAIQRWMKAAESSCCMQLPFGAGAGRAECIGALVEMEAHPFAPSCVESHLFSGWKAGAFAPGWWSEHSLPSGSGWCLVWRWLSCCISEKLSGLLDAARTTDSPEIMHFCGT